MQVRWGGICADQHAFWFGNGGCVAPFNVPSFGRSGHELIVVDVQGVGDLYTDPQIHTATGKAAL